MSNDGITPEELFDEDAGLVMVMSVEEMMDMFGGELFGPPPTKEDLEKDLQLAEGDLANFKRLKTALEELRASDPGTSVVFDWEDEELGTSTLTHTETGSLTSASEKTGPGGNFENEPFEDVIQSVGEGISGLEEFDIPNIKAMLADLEGGEE